MSETVVVALSGGVDSSVAAAMLVEAGHRVVGISMRLYDAKGSSQSIGGRCCGPRDLEDARAVCAHLGIPFYVANYTEEFGRQVIDDFVAEYTRGRTPNPCVRCNEQVKFTPLVKRARALGARALATGHYARIDEQQGRRRLRRAVDERKDQSYFLFAMDQAALSFAWFPLGALGKDEVRARARAYGLPNADKADSQEICFVPDGDHAALVDARSGARSGDIVAENGHVLGQHEGVHRFTIGQRRGLGFGVGEPLYVLRLDAERQQVVVGPESRLGRREMIVDDVRWTMDPAPGDSIRAAVQIRYRHAPQPATVWPLSGGRARVEFDEPERAIAPGQAAVLYQDDVVLGGGWIA